MRIQFREVDQFNCWIWIRFSKEPSQGERNYLDGVFDSWYVIGRMGGFNSENLQAHEASSELSWLDYDNNHSSDALPALMHNVGQMEYEGNWARCWIDFGTSDNLAIDILINSLIQIEVDLLEIEEILIGGVNEDWTVEDHPDALFSSLK